jgi:hypothetical protein
VRVVTVGIMRGVGGMKKSVGETPTGATKTVAVPEAEGNGEKEPLSLPSPRIGGARVTEALV